MFKILNHRWFDMSEQEIEDAQLIHAQYIKSKYEVKEQNKLVKKRSISTIPKDKINNLNPNVYNRSTRLETFNRMVRDSTDEVEEAEKARRRAYEQFNEKVFLSNSVQKRSKKKKVSIIQMIKKIESNKKQHFINRSAIKSKRFSSQEHSPSMEYANNDVKITVS